MINMVGLTFDWDDVSITDTKVQDALNDLDKDFPLKFGIVLVPVAQDFM